jgi:rhamnose utilization protein RhaD (predicted bifunctional aldolase and dehydrogenase)
MTNPLKKPQDLQTLAEISARIGKNPELIQAAGGNTSVKDAEVMWIKASGTLLAEALSRDIFVPVDLPAMRSALSNAATEADRPIDFSLGTDGLRPSIETSLHAVFKQRVVIHVHCVNTLSWAIRQDAKARLAGILSDFNWAFVAYHKPGANLARAVSEVMSEDTDVIILQNHGLIIAAETVEDADALLNRVVAAVAVTPAAGTAIDHDALAAHTGLGWSVPDPHHPLHQIALNAEKLQQATQGSLYPDHVIFCGIGAQTLTADCPAAGEDAPAFLLIEGVGAIIQASASEGALALCRCLGDVFARTDPDAQLSYLTEEQNHELLDWDAEKYRKALNV